jgi:hypothetical protein
MTRQIGYEAGYGDEMSWDSQRRAQEPLRLPDPEKVRRGFRPVKRSGSLLWDEEVGIADKALSRMERRIALLQELEKACRELRVAYGLPEWADIQRILAALDEEER